MKKQTLRKTCAAIAALGACYALAADIKVGAPFALTGPVAEQAKAMRQGAELAALHVNQQGGVLGQNYQLIFADTACDPEKGTQAVQQLVDSGVLALVGPVCSGVTLRQARSVSIPAGVVTLSVASASSLITHLNDQDLVFRTAPSDAAKGKALAQVAFDQGSRKIAVSHASDAYNTSVAQAFSSAFKALGGEVTLEQVHQPKQADYAGEVRAATAAAQDLALFAYSGSGGIQYLKNASVDSSFKRIYGTDGLMANELAAQLSAAQLGRMVFVLAASDTAREGYKRWQTLASAANLKADAQYVPNSYDAAFMMALAIEAAGKSDRNKISASLRNISGPNGAVVYPGEFKKALGLLKQRKKINYEGASGAVDFDANGDIAGRFSVHRFLGAAWQAKSLK